MENPEHNHHHLFWERRNYKDKVSSTFRNHQSLIVLTPKLIHRELHAQLRPPLKPSRDLMLGALSLLDEYDRSDRFYGLESMIDYFGTKDQPDAPRIALHLEKQLGILKGE